MADPLPPNPFPFLTPSYAGGRNSICRADTPYPSVSQESVPSQIDNLTNALYGAITKTVQNNRVIWNIPCDPNHSAEFFNLPRGSGEGLMCYIMRVLNAVIASGNSSSQIAGGITCYAAARTDGLTGTGTISSPFNVSTQALFDSVIPSLPVNSTIYLMAGTYQTHGVTLPAGSSLIGFGANITTITLTAVIGDAIMVQGSGDNCIISNITFDGNWQNISQSNKKMGCALLSGNNCTIEHNVFLNFGGNTATLQECFPVHIAGVNATVRKNKLYNPQSGTYSAGVYASYIWIGGVAGSSGRIVDNYILGNGSTLSGMGVVGGDLFDSVEISGNTFENLGEGIHGDSWTGKNLKIINNKFLNCSRAIGLTFNGTTSYINGVLIDSNIFIVPPNGISTSGGASLRATNVTNMSITRNTIVSLDGSYVTEGAFFVGGNTNVKVADNIIHTTIGTSNCISAMNGIFADNNVDENGTGRFDYNAYSSELHVKGGLTDAANGLELFRALQIANGSVPNSHARSQTNRCTIFVSTGVYDTQAVMAPDSFVSIVGLGDARDVVIKNTTGLTFDLVPNSVDYITFKNITMTGSGGAALTPNGNSNLYFESVIFNKEGSGTIITPGAWTLAGKLVNCSSIYPIVGANQQGVFSGTAIGCVFNGFESIVSGTMIDCIITDRLGFYGFSGLLKGCVLTAVNPCVITPCSGTIDGCTLNNYSLALATTGTKLYNTIINSDASVTYSISSAGASSAITLFNVGSNKPVSGTVTVTRLTSL